MNTELAPQEETRINPFGRRRKRPDGSGNVCGNYLRIYKNHEMKQAHNRIAEGVLGRPLPPGVVVHHVNENGLDNRNENLVICPSAAYHKLLHRRMRALAATGDPNKLKCRFCKQWDKPENIAVFPAGNHHRACMNAYYRNRRAKQ